MSKKYEQMWVPKEFKLILKVRYNGKEHTTNMARMRELLKELEEITYGKKRRNK